MKKKQAKLRLINYEGVKGYTMSNIEQVLDKETYAKFIQWMNGQTTTVYKNGDSLVYPVDFERFLKGLPALD